MVKKASKSNKQSAAAAVPQDDENNASTMSFLAPDVPLDPQQVKQEGFFPPTIFSDMAYFNGIRVFPKEISTAPNTGGGGEALMHTISLQEDTNDDPSYMYTPRGYKNESTSIPPPTLPVLTAQESEMWTHKWAAKSAAMQTFPVTAFRLLGTITRKVHVANDARKGPFTNLLKSMKELPSGLQNDRKPQKMTRHNAKVEARVILEEASSQGHDETTDTTQLLVEAKTDEIFQAWTARFYQGTLRKGWDTNGELCREHVNDEEYVPIHSLRRWLVNYGVVDAPGQTTTKILYDGRRSVQLDILSVVNSILELSSPAGLYSTPLILPYAVVTIEDEKTNSTRPSTSRKGKTTTKPPLKKAPKMETFERTWKIRIGVYMNRLLPEVLTCRDLLVIMSALDEGSFRVSEPLHLPPTPSRPTFQSSPFPTVVFDDAELLHAATTTTNAADSSDDEEKKCEEDVVDLTIGDSTREESTISAFSITGFLKLLENTGNDVSNWPAIEAKISPTIKLELMLHQKHAVSWMLQMESLEGFGINSILWEERSFLDGGKYYYSPGLGQIRLRAPPKMKGGILADEMGLGKTLEVLGLVVATLDDLKRESGFLSADGAKKSNDDDDHPVENNKTHATLIIVPPALVGQWLSEIEKAVGDELTVEFFDYKEKQFEHKLGKEGMPDIVVTTYIALEKNPSARHLAWWSWGRVVLDEMQEVRSSTSRIAKMCDSLDCGRRWMISGTPLFDGIGDLRGELNFVRLEPYGAATEDGFFDFSITNHWEDKSMHGLETLQILGLLMLRRSKNMTIAESGHPLLGLKPLTVEYLPVPQDPSERALYCFMESLVARELKTLKDGETKTAGSKRKLCLRLLRELCMTPVILNGGAGAPSQLDTLNKLMIDENRREMYERGVDGSEANPSNIMSCDEAIRFLSQAQETAHVQSDFVTTQAMGVGGGISNRSRAVESIGDKIQETKESIDNAAAALRTAKTKRARSLWHFALEKVTTGQAPIAKSALPRINAGVLRLWKWRSLVIQLSDANYLNRNKKLPTILMRGWRPTKDFRSILYSKQPSFAWAHPWALCVQDIPNEISLVDVKNAVVAVLQREDKEGEEQEYDDFVEVVAYPSGSSSWNAMLQLADKEMYELVKRRAASSHGFVLPSEEIVPAVKEKIRAAEEKLEEAEAQHKIYPSISSRQDLAEAKKTLRRASLGLRIAQRKHSDEVSQVLLSDPIGSLRSEKPESCAALYDSFKRNKPKLDQTIGRNSLLLAQGEDKLRRLGIIDSNRVDANVESMSAFQTLEALSSGNKDKTMCTICLNNLGNGQDDDDDNNDSMVAMTRCGHLFCLSCLKTYASGRFSDHEGLVCPNCRKNFAMRQIIRVDPTKTTDVDAVAASRKRAKELVLQASKMLDESDGQLDAELWGKLYLAIDLPEGADRSRHSRYTAIPGDVAAHLRRAVGMPLDSAPSILPGRSIDHCLSSKVRALIADLPSDERSVVFSSSKASVKHLVVVLREKGIGCRSLYTRQNVDETEAAVNEWKSVSVDSRGKEFIPYPVLVVQAGAAASGLTLTAASKIFVLDLLVRSEEEQQAFGRCHRYGQTKEVHCKCYYTPVSVESRLLEWRKRSANEGAAVDRFKDEEKHVVYAKIRGMEDDDDDEDSASESEDEAEELDRTRFLLGLHNHHHHHHHHGGGEPNVARLKTGD